jgi:hypothetical protein
MTPDKCPGCGAKLRPDMLACPNCPMSFPEDDGPRGSGNPLKQSPLYKFLLPSLFFGGLGAGIWYLGTGLMRLGTDNSQVENGNLFGEKPPPAAAPRAPTAGAAAPPPMTGGDAVEAPPAEGEGKEMLIISHLDENGTPIDRDASGAVTRPAPSRTAPPSAKPPREWKFRGEVYDLLTLKPLAGCALTFTDSETNRSIKTRTDSGGRYRAIVPPLSGGRGYSVAIERNGYAPNYLDPSIEGVRDMAAGERKNLARDLSATLASEPAIVSSASEKPLVTDFYIAPRP